MEILEFIKMLKLIDIFDEYFAFSRKFLLKTHELRPFRCDLVRY